MCVALSEAVRHDEPVAFMVFAHEDVEHDYKVFPTFCEADAYAYSQAEKAWWKSTPESQELPKWPIYALWAADIGEVPHLANASSDPR
jgi:hypothetical protein